MSVVISLRGTSLTAVWQMIVGGGSFVGQYSVGCLAPPRERLTSTGERGERERVGGGGGGERGED